MSMYTFAINFISEENPTFCSRTRSPLSPATCEHSAHSPSRQVSQAAGTGPPPRQACVSARPRTEQFLKLCTVCKQHLPKKAPGDTKEPWRAAGMTSFSQLVLQKCMPSFYTRMPSPRWSPRSVGESPPASQGPSPTCPPPGWWPATAEYSHNRFPSKGLQRSGKQADPQAFYCGPQNSDFNLETLLILHGLAYCFQRILLSFSFVF